MNVRAIPTLGELRKRTAGQFRAAGIESAELDARLLIAHALGIETAELAARPDQAAEANKVSRLAGLTKRRLAGEPVARILGKKEFWSREFLLGPDTLVPRPESETVVEAALVAKPGRDAPLRILDLGTGAGILLAATLLERPHASGIGIDRSMGALQVARRNFERHGLAGRAAFLCGDWGAAVGREFDLIVSNPPYVESSSIAALGPEVRDHDPPLALDGGPDGLDACREICSGLSGLLAPGGAAVVELGMGQLTAVSDLAREAGLIVNDVKSDLAGCPRALVLGSD